MVGRANGSLLPLFLFRADHWHFWAKLCSDMFSPEVYSLSSCRPGHPFSPNSLLQNPFRIQLISAIYFTVLVVRFWPFYQQLSSWYILSFTCWVVDCYYWSCSTSPRVPMFSWMWVSSCRWVSTTALNFLLSEPGQCRDLGRPGVVVTLVQPSRSLKNVSSCWFLQGNPTFLVWGLTEPLQMCKLPMP